MAGTLSQFQRKCLFGIYSSESRSGLRERQQQSGEISMRANMKSSMVQALNYEIIGTYAQTELCFAKILRKLFFAFILSS